MYLFSFITPSFICYLFFIRSCCHIIINSNITFFDHFITLIFLFNFIMSLFDCIIWKSFLSQPDQCLLTAINILFITFVFPNRSNLCKPLTMFCSITTPINECHSIYTTRRTFLSLLKAMTFPLIADSKVS